MVLAGVLAISAGSSVFAANPTSTEITGQYEPVEIAVDVPSRGNVIINPYKLPTRILSTIGYTYFSVSVPLTQQVVSGPMAVINRSRVDLDVTASVAGEAKGGLTLSGEPLEKDDTGKKAFVYFQMAGTQKTELGEVITDVYYSYPWPGYTAARNLVVQDGRTSKFETDTTLATIKKADRDGNPVPGSLAMFRLTGTCVKAPKIPWTTDDGFTATISFTFTPSEEQSP